MPPADLETGVWFWRVAGGAGSLPGPLWSLIIRKSAGRSSRVHGFDANGDGLADVPIEASMLFGSAPLLAERLTRVPYAKLDAAVTDPATAPRRRSNLLFPTGDIDGDGFDDAVLEARLVRGGPAGILPEAQWLPCPTGGCGAVAGDVDDDGYADLYSEDGLQLGGPTGLRLVSSPLFKGAPIVRAAPDLDGDGVGDLALMSADHRRLTSIRGGRRGPTLDASTSIDVPANAGASFEVADVDGDGLTDLVILLTETSPGADPTLRATVIARLTPTGGDISHAVERRVTWSTRATDGTRPSAQLYIADVDGDGFDDIVVFLGGPHVGHARVIRGSRGALHLEPGRVGFEPKDDISGVGFRSTGDINGDGYDDVMFVGRPSVGYRQTFDFYLGGKTGLQPRPFAQYTMSASDRVPRRD